MTRELIAVDITQFLATSNSRLDKRSPATALASTYLVAATIMACSITNSLGRSAVSDSL